MHHDNRRVQDFLMQFPAYSDLKDAYPCLDDVFTGASWLQTNGEAHTRPLHRGFLFHTLQALETIDVTSLIRLETGKGRSTLARYAIAGRIVSKQIALALDRNPGWE